MNDAYICANTGFNTEIDVIQDYPGYPEILEAMLEIVEDAGLSSILDWDYDEYYGDTLDIPDEIVSLMLKSHGWMITASADLVGGK